MSIADAICEAHTAEVAWNLIRTNRDVFFWTDDEDHASTWNRLYCSNTGRSFISKEWRFDSLWLTCGDKTAQVFLRSNRDDRWLQIHAIAKLVHDEREFRLCRDSAHSSDQAFLALLHKDWLTLESKFGLACTDRRFLKINKDFDEFLKDICQISTEPMGRLDPALTNWVGGSSYQPSKLDYLIVSHESGHLERSRLLHLVERNLVPGLVHISTDTNAEIRWVVDRSLMVETVAPIICRCTVRVVDATSNGFLIIERVGVAAAWRTDDRMLPEKTDYMGHRHWWEFWKPR